MKKLTQLVYTIGIVCSLTIWYGVAQMAAIVKQQPVYNIEAIPLNAPDWFYEGDQSAANLGFSVNGSGDVNGDGYDDVLVSATKYSSDSHKAGAVFAFFGSVGGLPDVPNWTFSGDESGIDLGFSVAHAGDVNDDGFDDVIIGAPRYNGGEPREGRVYGFYGSATGLAATPDWWVESDLPEARLGWAVSSAGDVNGDGYDDVILGAKWAEDTFSSEGMAQVYLGGETGLANLPTWTIYGGQAGASLGTAVSSAGDINKDGYADVIVGAPLFNGDQDDMGKVLAYCGADDGLSEEPCWSVTGEQLNGRLGEAVSGGGDVNGDGFDDILLGAPGWDSVQTADCGAAYLYLGSSSGLNEEPQWTAVSDQSISQFGTAVKTGSDINNDGYDDVVIGAYTYSADQSEEGRVFVYYGSLIGLSTQPSWAAEGNKAEAEFGYGVGIGDVNGNGQDEVLVGSPNYRKETELRGRIFLYEAMADSPQTETVFLPLIINK